MGGACTYQHNKPAVLVYCLSKDHTLRHSSGTAAGLCFLAAFFTWGALCAARLSSTAGRAGTVAVWGAVAASAALVLIAQALIQALFFVGNDAWASDPQTQEILELLGCPKAQSRLDVFLVCLLPSPCQSWGNAPEAC